MHGCVCRPQRVFRLATEKQGVHEMRTAGFSIGTIAWLLFVVISSFGCGSPHEACRVSGEACAATTDCCPAFVCSNGACTNSCAQSGQTCVLTNGGGSNCCAGSSCVSGKCTSAMCNTVGMTCTTMLDCCQGATCPRFGSMCALGNVGDPCQENADCRTTLTCNGSWCTKTCATQFDCGVTNYCIKDSTGMFSCFPSCGTGARQDCSPYPGTRCTTGSAPMGVTLPICSQ